MTLAGGAVIVGVDPAVLVDLATRLAPVFLFVISMSVVVNIASQVGVFETVTQTLEKIAPAAERPRRHVLWAGLIVIAVVVTVFLSLDTTAILLTPLAAVVARRNGINVVAVSLAIIWIANLASLPLPVSNLTNLLSLNSPVFLSETDYMIRALFPAIAAVAVAVSASWVAYARLSAPAQTEVRGKPSDRRRDPLLAAGLVTLAILLPALASPIPYWLSSAVAALVLLCLSVLRRPRVVSLSLVPWSSLLLVTGLSAVATALNLIGGAELGHFLLGDAENSPAGLVALAAVGAVASNLINNIPAFLALEPAVTTSTGYLALLIGVNAGPIVTPWASLATLLWHNQLVRAGVVIRWRTYVVGGLMLVPIAVILPTAVLILQNT